MIPCHRQRLYDRVSNRLGTVLGFRRSCGLCLRPRFALTAENLFLRKQLAFYQERHDKPRRSTPATRIALIWLARWFDWRRALPVV
jgi:glycine/D-amino acid oxidase-like deaminating enzyme